MQKLINKILTTVISPEEAAADGLYEWLGAKNDTEFRGVVPGYICAWCVEVKDSDGKLGYMSCTFTNDYEAILLPETDKGDLCDVWNDLGISAHINYKYKPTGRIVFRGYHNEVWIPEEREYGYTDASREVEKLFAKFVSEVV